MSNGSELKDYLATISGPDEFYVITGDDDGHNYMVPLSRLKAVNEYFEEFYRLIGLDTEASLDRAYALTPPVDFDRCKVEGEIICFRDWRIYEAVAE